MPPPLILRRNAAGRPIPSKKRRPFHLYRDSEKFAAKKFSNANGDFTHDVKELLRKFVDGEALKEYLISWLEDTAKENGNGLLSLRLQERRNQRQLEDTRVNGNGLLRLQHRAASPEIVEVQDETVKVKSSKPLMLDVGSVLMIEDSSWQKVYQVEEIVNEGEMVSYIACSVDNPGKSGEMLLLPLCEP